MHGAASIVGIGESEYYERGRSPHTEFQLACIAIQRAVADAGLELADIDGFISYADTRITRSDSLARSDCGSSAGPEAPGAAAGTTWPLPSRPAAS